MKKLKILYVDSPFLGMNAGDKNRSKFLYKSLLEEYETDILLIKEFNDNKKILHIQKYENNVYFIKNKQQKFYNSSSIFNFDKKNIDSFKDLILKNSYDLIFFRFSSSAQLIKICKNIDPFIKIIIDVDMVLSKISSSSWKNNKKISNRYFFFESLKLHIFEKDFFNQNYTFLYTNKNELEFVKNEYLNTSNNNHFILPNVINPIKDDKINYKTNKTILFYGVLNSTANISAYLFLINEIYPLIKDFLLKENIKILIVGKNRNTIHNNPPLNIEIIGEVPDVVPYIKQALMVLFPLQVAAGTLTRILEVAYLKKAIIASLKAANGLELENKILICEKKEDFAKNIMFLYKNKKSVNHSIKKTFDFVKKSYNANNVKNQMFNIINKIKSNINIIHLARRFTPISWGGTENVIIAISNSLKEKGFNSTIISSNILSSSKTEIISKTLVKRFSYFYPYFFLSKQNKRDLDLIGGNIFSFSLLKYLMFCKDIDLVHLHTGKRFGSIARTICILRKIPYIVTIHGGLYNINKEENKEIQKTYYFEWGKVLGFIFGSRRVYKDANAIITLNKKEYDLLKKQYSNKDIYLLSNSINVKDFELKKEPSFRNKYNIPQDKFVFLISARIDKQKNHLLVLKAFNKLLKENPNIYLLMIGNITDYDYYMLLKEYIKRKKLEKNTSFITSFKAQDKDLFNAYINSNSLILASVHEPFGIVGLEAWASNLPLIVSDISGICNILTKNINALIFKNNSISSLVNKMHLISSNDILYKSLIYNSKKEVLKYDNSLINSKISSIYKTCIKNNSN